MGINTILGVADGIELALVILGTAVSSIFIVWCGIQLVMSQGDPQAVARVRNSFIGVCIGILLMAVGPTLPGLVLDVIPRGSGVRIPDVVSNTCDDRLRREIVANSQYRTGDQMQYLVSVLQAVDADNCGPEFWEPYFYYSTSHYLGKTSYNQTGCISGDSDPKVQGVDVPDSLITIDTSSKEHMGVNTSGYYGSGRDHSGNILAVVVSQVGPHGATAPAVFECWLYHRSTDHWFVGIN